MGMNSRITSPPGWKVLEPKSQAGRIGCLFILAILSLTAGALLGGLFFLSPVGRNDVFVPLVAAVLALVGGVLFFAGIRGTLGSALPPSQLSVEEPAAFRPGRTLRLRLLQPGPTRITSLRLRATCERVYKRRLRVRNGWSTVEDYEVLWEQRLLDVPTEQVPEHGILEHELTLVLSPDARPSGPAQPDGVIRWRLEVSGESGAARAAYQEYDIRVEAAETSEMEARAPATGERPKGDSASAFAFRAGCLGMALLFLASGGFLLWMFWTGAAFRGRGNPYVPLVAGLAFGGLGLLGLVVAIASLIPGRGRDARPEPGAGESGEG